MKGAYKNMKDMFDRGGANARGGIFQGGGILSDIANSLFPPTQTSGFGTSAKILGERSNSSGMSRPYDPNFFDEYYNEMFTRRIPRDMSYDAYYEKIFP